MQIYEREGSHLFCGHWNGSPVEIGEGRLTAVPHGEVRRKHPYHEYYVVLEGAAQLEVNGRTVSMYAGSVVMVEPREWHQITAVSPAGARWVIFKERSAPRTKILENGETL